MEEVSELQSRRASNIIWNAAKSHDFTPTFKCYTDSGEADIYWNCIIGAVRRHYDYPQIEKVFRAFQDYEDANMYEGLLWLGIENCVFEHEKGERPFLSSLRDRYAEAFLKEIHVTDDYDLYGALATAHYQRILGREVKLSKYDITLLDELEFPASMTTEEIVEKSKQLFEKWFHIRAEERKKERPTILNPFKKAKKLKKGEGRYRKFGIGFADHPENVYGGAGAETAIEKNPIGTKMTDSELRQFMAFKYGKSIYSDMEIKRIEKETCCGNHNNCHLHFTRGEKSDGDIVNGFEALQKEKEAKQIIKNREFFERDLARNRTAINRLTERIQNSVLLHLHPAHVKSNSGALSGGRVWRALNLNDDKVFTKTEQSDMGDLSVDILLDASTSQRERQEIVAAQGYMIAEALKKCSVPCRISSFCSMTGYTIIKIFTDYGDTDNTMAFDFVANGCNRDGLAIRAIHRIMNQSPYYHKILIILSDVKPNDIIKIRTNSAEELVPYETDAGVKDTLYEVRSARADGISVICVFTGEDEDVPSAKKVYGRDFARIKSLDMLADTVGILLQNQIRNI